MTIRGHAETILLPMWTDDIRRFGSDDEAEEFYNNSVVFLVKCKYPLSDFSNGIVS